MFETLHALLKHMLKRKCMAWHLYLLSVGILGNYEELLLLIVGSAINDEYVSIKLSKIF